MITQDINKSNKKFIIKAFLKELKHKKIKLWVENENLRFKAPQGVMSEEIIKNIKLHKIDIINELKSQEAKKIFLQPIANVSKQKYYSLSSAQKRVYYIQQLDPDSTAYNLTQVLWIDGEIDTNRIQKIIKQLMERHEMLRTSIKLIDNQPVLDIQDYVEFQMQHMELENDKQKIDNEILAFVKPFNLKEAPLFRVKCIKILKENPAYLLVYDMHHLISDGISIGLLVQEVNKLYDNQITPLPKIQYKDYINWQKEFSESDEYKIQKSYWQKQFSNEIPLLQINTDFPRPAVFDFHGNTRKFSIEKNLSDRLYKIARENNTTLYSLLLSCYYIFLHKYSAQNDLIVGTPTAGRRHSDLYNILGIFVNTLALRMNCDGKIKFQDFLNHVSGHVLEAFDNQEYQFDELISALKIERSQSRNPLFDTMFVLQNMNIGEVLINNAKVSYYDFPVYHSQFDITLTAIEKENGIEFEFEYCTKLFKPETIVRMQEHFLNIINQINENIQIPINQISLIDDEEKKQLLYDFNSKKIDYPKNISLVNIFNQIVNTNSDHIAVKYLNENITYEELDKKSNRLAQLLHKKGIKKESVIALFLDQNIDTIVCLLGVLKAGGAFLPIDKNYPEDRIKYMLSDSRADFLITNIDDINTSLFEGTIINLQKIKLDENEDVPVEVGVNPDDLAYIIYTSGTTGKPKGVMVEHKNVVNLLYAWKIEYLDKINKINLLQLASFAFDVFVADFLRSILTGGSMIICPAVDRLNPEKIVSMISENQISIMDATPAIVMPLMDLVHIQKKDISSLEVLIVGSDKISVDDFNLLCDRFEDKFRILNCFGITETTIDSCYFERRKGESVTFNNTPIGKPLPNMYFYVLDTEKNLVPIGVPGELYIAGDGVARGYLNKESLTAEKFVTNYFDSNQKMYRTGDRVRWLESGDIEFLGRIDHQIKVRGYRIEIGEIQAALYNYNGIKNTHIKAKTEKNGTNNLCAYIESEVSINQTELKSFLMKKLPNYMVPVYYVILKNFPLTENGKIDHRALPEPESLMENRDYVAPSNDKENQLVKIWQQVLNIDKIGTNDNFFDLGGDSIKAIQVISKLSNIGYKIEVKDLFERPDIQNLALKLRVEKNIIPQDEVTGEISLTPIQKWLFEKNDISVNHYNQAVMLFKKDRFDEKSLKQVFAKLIQHHDSLRMVFIKENGKIRQINRDISGKLFDFYKFDYSGQTDFKKNIIEKTQLLHQEIDIENGPMVKISLFNTDKGDHLLIIIHHLVIDGISWRILLEDFTQAYQQIIKNQDINLFRKTNSFKTWSNKLINNADKKQFLQEKQYWNSLENSEIESLISNYEINENNYSFKNIECRLDKEQTELLLKKVNKAYHTEINDILLTALGLAVKKVFNKNNILINLEGHGREEIFKDVQFSRTVGWFTSQYPVLLSVTNEKELDMNIKKIKESIRNIPNKGIGYGVLEYLTNPENKKELSFSLKPEITFNYLGQFSQEINNELFQISDISTGQWNDLSIKKEQLIEINGLVVNNELKFDFEYNKRFLPENDIKKLTEEYIIQLKQIIKHCSLITKEEYTPSDYKINNLSIKDFDYIVSSYPKNDIEKIYYLSPMQEGMLFHSLINENSNVYFEQTTFMINGDINVEFFEKSIQLLIDRHDILRTNFVSSNITKPVQVVFKNKKFKLDFIDLSKSNKLHSDIINEYQSRDRQKGYNLMTDCLFRISIIKLNEGKSSIIFSFHHIIMDGWCIGLIMSEILKLYSLIKESKKIDLPDPIQFENYINWIKVQEYQEAINYWKNYLIDFETKSVIKSKNHMYKKNEYKVANYLFKLDKKLTDIINKFVKINQVTISTFIQMVWGIFLQRYNNTDDVLFGIVDSGRQSQINGVESIIGLFINTIPLRIKFDKDSKVNNVMKQIQTNFLNSQKYNYLHLSDIQNLTSLKNNLMDHIMIFENYPLNPELLNTNEKLGFIVDDVKSFEQTNYDFNFVVYPGEELTFNYNYNSNIYSDSEISGIKEHFLKIIEEITQNQIIKISDIDIVLESEKNTIFNTFNNNPQSFNSDDTIISLFYKQVQLSADKTAVVDQDQSYTYRQLDEKSNKLAHSLKHTGVKREEIVAVMIERSIEMVIAILAILKSGAAYLPIDPGYPDERIKYILKDSNSSILLTKGKNNKIPNLDIKIINLDDLKVYSDNSQPLVLDYKENDLCYVIYTSGSTGKPKGVLLEQKGLINLVHAQCESFQINKGTNVLQFASFGFDASVSEIFTTLLSGAILHLFTQEVSELYNVLKSSSINVATLPPSILRVLSPEGLKDLRTIISAGESCDNTIVKKWSEGRKFINAYGPTESTVCATLAENIDPEGLIHIGKPMKNIEILILNKSGKLQPIGSPGELCISGIGLARGYLNNQQLTKEKFITHPFDKKKSIYKTGDLARWFTDGNIEFLGRIDNQVKIRGYRIELQEIESVLISHFLIKEACVTVIKNSGGDPELCAYYVSQDVLEKSILINHLKNNLPDYMIPLYFVYLEKIPLNNSGKIDRKSLPIPNHLINLKTEYKAPENELQEKLANIWGSILMIKKIGINDNFFDLGGHSIKAIQVVNAIENQLNIKISINDLFDNPTITKLSDNIDTIKQEETLKIEHIEEKEDYDVIFGFKGSIILQQMNVNNNRGSSSVASEIYDLDKAVFEKTVMIIVERHEILRSTFKIVNSKVKQKVVHINEYKMDIEYLDYSQNEKEYQIDDIIELTRKDKFDLINGPLFICRVVEVKDNKSFIHFCVDHIIFDKWSADIIQNEFMQIYSALITGKENPIIKRPYQFQDYYYWIERLFATKGNEIKQFWTNVFSEQVKKENFSYYMSYNSDVKKRTLSYKVDIINELEQHVGRALTQYEREELLGEIKFAKQYESGILYYTKLFPEEYKKLKTVCKKYNYTHLPFILAAFNLSIYALTMQNDNIFSCIVVDRNNPELSEIIGCMIKPVLLRKKIDENLNIIEYIKAVYENYKNAVKYLHYQSEKLLNDFDISAHAASIEFLFQEPINKPLKKDEKVSEFSNQNIGPWHDLTVSITPYENGLELKAIYNKDMFKNEVIENFYSTVKIIILKMLDMMEQPVRELIIEMHGILKNDYNINKILVKKE